MTDFFFLTIGVVIAAAGGDLFVRGSVGLARAFRVPAGIVGSTVAAFATSSPELAVSSLAALAGTPQIGLGDALGSNVVNVALVLGAALCISAMIATRDSVHRDFPVALAAPGLTGILLLDGLLSRLDALFLLGAFFAWLIVTIRAGMKYRLEGVGEFVSWRQPVVLCCGGLVLLLLAGRFIVEGASAIAVALEVDAYIVGVTIVAVGTSAPELATTIAAKLRGQDDLGLGTIIGSNIFNGLAIVPIAGLIAPIAVDWRSVAGTLLIGTAALAFVLPGSAGQLGRGRGVALVLLYLLHVGLAFNAA